jgi:hypothetical protein
MKNQDINEYFKKLHNLPESWEIYNYDFFDFGASSLLMVLISFLIPEKEKLSIFRLLSASAIFALLAIAAK